MDALEVKMESKDLDSEEESTVSESVKWDILEFDQDFIEIQLYFDEPELIGSS